MLKTMSHTTLLGYSIITYKDIKHTSKTPLSFKIYKGDDLFAKGAGYADERTMAGKAMSIIRKDLTKQGNTLDILV